MRVARAALLDRLAVVLPIFQAPMAGVSSPEMAAAASNAGALGAIGVGAVEATGARDMIEAVRARTAFAFNVNLFCHAPARPRPDVERAWIARLRPRFAEFGIEPPDHLAEIYRSFQVDEAMLAMLIEVRPPVVSFHFGLPPSSAIHRLRDAGIVLIATATKLHEARAIETAGLDAIIAQGWEAGGHRGCFDPDALDEQLGMAALTRLLVDEMRLPVIAAGGIMEGADIAAALRLGAAAAQLGTAFIGSTESLADEGYRAALAGAGDTAMTRVLSGRPARCLANRFTALGTGVPDAAVPDYPRAYDLGKALHAAAKARGDYGFGAQWAGQGVRLARALPTARLVGTLARELEEALQ